LQISEQGNQRGGDIFDCLIESGIVDELLAALRTEEVDPALLRLLQRHRPAPAPSSAAAEGTSAPERGSRNVTPGVEERKSAERGAESSRSAPDRTAEARTLEPGQLACRLTVEVVKGRAFLAHLDGRFLAQDDEEEVSAEAVIAADRLSQSVSSHERFYVLHALCKSQRWHSEPVKVSVEPTFRETIDFDVTPWISPSITSAASHFGVPSSQVRNALLQDREASVHLTLTMVSRARSISAATRDDVTVDLIGTCSVEWRTLVSSVLDPVADAPASITNLVPILPAGPGPHAADKDGIPIPVGLLELEMRLECAGILAASLDTTARHSQGEPVIPSTVSDVNFLLHRQNRSLQDAGRAFFTYAKGWWSEYKNVHPSFRSRPVKIFGENERGEFQSVCTYVRPLVADRALGSSFEAARFVSLIPYQRHDAIAAGGGSRREVWHAPHLTLALRQGTLCSVAICRDGSGM
jgi:hypothetical protein